MRHNDIIPLSIGLLGVALAIASVAKVSQLSGELEAARRDATELRELIDRNHQQSLSFLSHYRQRLDDVQARQP